MPDVCRGGATGTSANQRAAFYADLPGFYYTRGGRRRQWAVGCTSEGGYPYALEGTSPDSVAPVMARGGFIL
jgi:hypothetical protein